MPQFAIREPFALFKDDWARPLGKGQEIASEIRQPSTCYRARH